MVHDNCLFKFGGGSAGAGCGLCSRCAIRAPDNDVVLWACFEPSSGAFAVDFEHVNSVLI